MTITAQGSIVSLVFGIAGIAALVVVLALLGFLAFSWLREGSQGRRIIGQEMIWTLVPALVLMGLAVVCEVPWGAGTGQDRPARGHVQTLIR